MKKKLCGFLYSITWLMLKHFTLGYFIKNTPLVSEECMNYIRPYNSS